MRAFDLLSKAESDIRTASQPRYQFEMVLLRWMHLRKLVPLAELMEQMGGAPARTAPPTAPARSTLAPTAKAPIAPTGGPIAPTRSGAVPPTRVAVASASAKAAADSPIAPTSKLKDALLAEIRRGKPTLYELHVAQAKRIDVCDAQVTFTFAANQTVARNTLDQNRVWIEAAAERIAGRRIAVTVVQETGAAPAPAADARAAATSPPASKRDLKAEALASPTVQAVLDVFPAEIRDVEEM